MSLRDALHHLQNAHKEQALDALLDAWRASKRHPAIADAIELLSATLTAKETPIRAAGGTSARAAWDAAASSKRAAAMMGRLLEAIADSTDRHRQIDVLLEMPADPRMATAAKRWLEDPPVRAASRAPFFHRVVRLIERTGDVRLTPFLVALTEPKNQSAASRAYGVQTWGALVAAAAHLAKRKVPDLDRDDTLTLAAIAKLVRAPRPSAGTAADEEALLARIYDDPTDDEARAVLADLLQQRGDPRGELIAMQLARHGTDREPSPAERKLVQQWGRVWLGPLAPALQKQGVVFERGFVARGRYVRAAGAKTIGAREWSTLTHLDVSARSVWDDSAPDLLWSDAARNLRHVTGVNPIEDLARLRRREQPMPWLSVGFMTSHWVYCASLEEGPQAVFPAVRKLAVRAEGDGNFFVNADEVLALLERWPAIVDFEIDAEPELVLGIRSDARGKQLERLVLDGPMGILTLEGDRLDFQPRSREDPTSFLEVVVERLEVRHVTVKAAS